VKRVLAIVGVLIVGFLLGSVWKTTGAVQIAPPSTLRQVATEGDGSLAGQFEDHTSSACVFAISVSIPISTKIVMAWVRDSRAAAASSWASCVSPRARQA